MTVPYPRTQERIAQWSADPDVVGIVWVGSRSRGHGDRYADDDLDVLLTPEAHARLAPKDCFEVEREPDSDPPRLTYDAHFRTLDELHHHAASIKDIDHWPYERAGVLLDRGGVREAVQAAAQMPSAFRRARVQHGSLDTILAAGRAKKTVLRGFPANTALLVARGAKALSRVLFALENRWVPLDHWLEPELRTLSDPSGVGPLIVEALTTCSHEPLLAGLEHVWPQLEAEGFPPRSGLVDFHVELLHPSRAAERLVHGLD